MSKRILFIFIFLSFIKLNISSQETSGYVLDEKDSPLPFATIVIQEKDDSAFIVGDITDSLGHFTLKIPSVSKESDLSVKVSILGYKTRILPYEPNMGHIKMESESRMLNDVIVKGNLPITHLKKGAIVSRIQGTILANLGSTEDVLTRLPLIIKRNGHIEVLGKGVPLLYINNKKVIDLSELELLHPNEIKSISIYNSSNVQFDASSRAIIKIETVKEQGDGLHLNANMDFIQGTRLSDRTQADIRYQHHKLNIFGIFSYKSNHKKGTDDQKVISKTDTLWEQEQNSIQYVLTKDFQAKLGFSYDINKNNSLGISYSYDKILKMDKHSTYTSTVWADKSLYDLLSIGYEENTNNKPVHQAEFYYTGKIKNVKIDADIEYYNHAYSLNTLNNEDSQNHSSRVVTATNREKNQLLTGKIALEHPFLRGDLSYGIENTDVNRHDDYISPSGIIPTTYSNIKEHTNGYFAQYLKSTSIGDFTIGLRYEHTNFNYRENDDETNHKRRIMNNLFPSFLWEKDYGNWQMQFSYSTSITRPSYTQLSNNIRYINRFTWQTGNPMLKPTFTHDITINGTWKFLQVDISYQFDHNAIVYWGNQLQTNSSVTLINYINMDKIPHFDISLSAQPTIGKWYPALDVGMDKQWLSLNSLGMLRTFNKPSFYGDFKNLIELPAGMVLNADISFMSKGHDKNTYINRNMFISDFGITKFFMNKALALELKVNDIFYDTRNSGIVSLGQSEVIENGRNDTRNVTLSLRYTFNKTPNKYKGKGVDSEKLNRF